MDEDVKLNERSTPIILLKQYERSKAITIQRAKVRCPEHESIDTRRGPPRNPKVGSAKQNIETKQNARTNQTNKR